MSFQIKRILKFTILKDAYSQFITGNQLLKNFLTNFSEVLIYKIIASLFLTIVTIITVRTITSSEFGQIGIINNLSYLVFVPMLLGVHSSMYKYLPISGETERNELIFYSALGSFFSVSLLVILFLSVFPFFVHQLNISNYLWKTGIIMAVFISFSALSESYLRGQKLFSDICKFRMITTIVNLLMIVLFYWGFHKKSLKYYFLSLAVSQILFSVLVIIRIRVKILTKINWAIIKKIYQYGITSSISMFLGGLLFVSDIFFVNYFCIPEQVGLYNAYQGFIKNIFSVLFYEVFLVVFVPLIAQTNNNQLVKRKIRVYSPLILFVIITGSSLAIIVFIKLFGHNYQLNYLYVALSSISIALYTIYQINLSIYNMEGNKSALMTGFTILLILPVSLSLQLIATKYWNLAGALVSVALTNLLLILSMEICFRLFSRSKRTIRN